MKICKLIILQLNLYKNLKCLQKNCTFEEQTYTTGSIYKTEHIYFDPKKIVIGSKMVNNFTNIL